MNNWTDAVNESGLYFILYDKYKLFDVGYITVQKDKPNVIKLLNMESLTAYSQPWPSDHFSFENARFKKIDIPSNEELAVFRKELDIKEKTLKLAQLKAEAEKLETELKSHIDLSQAT